MKREKLTEEKITIILFSISIIIFIFPRFPRFTITIIDIDFSKSNHELIKQ